MTINDPRPNLKHDQSGLFKLETKFKTIKILVIFKSILSFLNKISKILLDKNCAGGNKLEKNKIWKTTRRGKGRGDCYDGICGRISVRQASNQGCQVLVYNEVTLERNGTNLALFKASK